MKIFITGGTGFIGSRLSDKLVSLNHDVILLIRNPASLVPSSSNRISYINGDLADKEALKRGMAGCDLVFHLAAFTDIWSVDPLIPYKTNLTGTINVLEAALSCKVKKVIVTSTGGTLSYSSDGKPVNELTNPNPEYNTVYEKTKAGAEMAALEFSGKGIDVVIVNPSRVYGPGRLSKSNSVTRIIKLYLSGLWRIIPGNGNCIGNYVFVDDVVNGHIQAALYGKNGEKYILGGENLSFNQLFDTLAMVSGIRRKLFHLSFPVLKLFVSMNEFFSGLIKVPPLITSEWLDKYLNNWIMSSDKARDELGYKITPFSDGVKETVRWLRSK